MNDEYICPECTTKMNTYIFADPTILGKNRYEAVCPGCGLTYEN